MFLGIDQVRPHMILDHFGHQAGRGTTHTSDQVHDFFAAAFFFKRPLDRFGLSANATNAPKKLLFLTNGVCHGRAI